MRVAPLILAGLLAQTPAQPDSLSGGAGWVGAGLLGAVLTWLFLKALPDKDKQMTEKDRLLIEQMNQKDKRIEDLLKGAAEERIATIARYDEERAVERTSRHERAGQFQTMLNSIAGTFATTVQTIQDKQDKRHDTLLLAITAQTDALKIAFHEGIREGLKTVCQYRQQT